MKSERKKRILVICPHPENVAPGQRLKYEQYFTYLRSMGYEIVVSPFMTRRFWSIVYRRGFLLEKALWTIYGYIQRLFGLVRLPSYDGLYIFLWVVPFGPPVMEWLYCHLNRRVLYDIDDMVFLKPKSDMNPLVAMLKSRSRVVYMMKAAKHVITCTPVLDRFVRQYNDRTTDISSTINTETYRPANRYTNDAPIVLGWSGSHSTVKYLHLLRDVLVTISQQRRIRLLVIGDPEFRLPGVEVITLPWVEETEVPDLQRVDIGLYPLPDEEWVLGKSGLKALQYMALGIPTVATAIGANFRVVEDGVTGYLVKTDQEWTEKLLRLIDDPALRAQMGQRGRERVERYYSVRANRDRYLEIFDSVYGLRRTPAVQAATQVESA